MTEWLILPNNSFSQSLEGQHIQEWAATYTLTPLAAVDVAAYELRHFDDPLVALDDAIVAAADEYPPCPLCGRTWWRIEFEFLQCLECGHNITNPTKPLNY